jgi:hypothetical protein
MGDIRGQGRVWGGGYKRVLMHSLLVSCSYCIMLLDALSFCCKLLLLQRSAICLAAVCFPMLQNGL